MVSSSASASPTFSAAAGPYGRGRAQPGTLLAPLGGARPGRTRAAGGDRSGWRHTRPYRRAGRDRRRRATRVCAQRAGPATRRPVPCEQAYASEPRRSSSEVDDLRRAFQVSETQRKPILPVVERVGARCAAMRSGAQARPARAARRGRVNLLGGRKAGGMCPPPASSWSGAVYSAFTRGGARGLLWPKRQEATERTCRPGPDNPEGDRTQHDSAGQGPGG